MKEYNKPTCMLLRIESGATMISGSSMEGGDVSDDPTSRFDVRRNILIDLEDDCFDE